MYVNLFISIKRQDSAEIDTLDPYILVIGRKTFFWPGVQLDMVQLPFQN